MAKDSIQKMLDEGAYKEIAAKARKGLKDESGMPYATIYKLLTGKNVPTVKKKEGGPMSKPKSKTQAFKEYRQKEGKYHKADPAHPMNKEGISKLQETKVPSKSLARRKKGGKMSYKKGGKIGCSHNRLY